MRDDPSELNNLANDPKYTPVLLSMTEKLLARINENTQMQPHQDRGPYRRIDSKEL